MKNLTSFLLACPLMMIFASCEPTEVVTPTPTPPTSPCETNQTAYVYFENKSNSNSTYTVVWDGSTVATLSPDEKSEKFTVAAGYHTLLFKMSNTGYGACNESNPNLAQCSTHTYSCSN